MSEKMIVSRIQSGNIELGDGMIITMMMTR